MLACVWLSDIKLYEKTSKKGEMKVMCIEK